MPGSSAIADFLKTRFPELGNRFQNTYDSPPRRAPSGDPPVDFTDTHLASTILGLTRYRSVDETLTDLTRQMLELHRRKEWRRVIQS
jgi:hypothetical protein